MGTSAKYPTARYVRDGHPQVFGFKIGKTYQYRDFGRGVEVYYGSGGCGCSLAMGYSMFGACFEEVGAEAPEQSKRNTNKQKQRNMITIDIEDVYSLMREDEKTMFVADHLDDTDVDTIIGHVAQRCDIESVIGGFNASEVESWLESHAEEYGYVKGEE